MSEPAPAAPAGPDHRASGGPGVSSAAVQAEPAKVVKSRARSRTDVSE
nr:MAG TPA: hypothetical protein [Caudoviricetes sp.]